MSESVDSEALRSQASRWSLAGDEQLLKVLQNMHQKLLFKCQEVDTSMEQMTAALDDANISLQNVNNKFMALSNSQFIESRVYDDDVDVAPGAVQPTEPSPPLQMEPNIDSLKRSLAILERLHEPVTIHDTDIDSDSEDDVSRVVLKPRDLYAHRPLPYIIGSQAWKNKWHAGLIVEDSDTESSTSKPDRDSEQYSESDSEAPPYVPGHDDGTISQSSGELSPEDPPQRAPRSQAAVADDLARRLGGPAPQPVTQEPPPVSYVPENVVKNIYKPQAQVAGTIFSDEPPPIEECQSEESDHDIFADLHKNQPYNNSNKERNRAAEDLFNKTSTGDGLSNKISTSQPAKQNSTLFEDESEPELFAPKSANSAVPILKETGAIKKPVGISLFGSNKGADNIGAAILRRNQKQSSSEDEADSILPQTAKRKNIPDKANDIPKERDVTDIQTDKPTEKDIFNNLFTKPTQKKNNENIVKDSVDTKKVDIFSDSIFDDIDDIFTSDVKKETNAKKSLFDDDDELFAEIAVKTEASKNTESLFDSDDELFAENKRNTKNNEINTQSKENSSNKDAKNKDSDVPKKTETSKLITSIFDDDSDTDIFSDLKTVPDNNTDNNVKNTDNVVDSQTDVTEQLFANTKDSNSNVTASLNNNNIESLKATDNNVNNNSEIINQSSIFDDDTDDIFSKPTNKVSINIENISKPNDNVKEALIEQDRVDISTNSTKDSNVQNPNDIFEQTDSPPDYFVQSENNIISEDKESEIPSADVNTSAVDAQKDTVNIGPIDSISNDIFSSLDKDLNEEAGLFQAAKSTIDKDTVITGVQTVSNKDVFSDIFTEPPVFEKPKEPKKSKNVNALFDDDSDDEGLFFKKSDADDVKPETFQNKDMFDIFLDEPPSIDIDFTSHNTDTKSNNLFKPENIEPVKSRMPDDLDLDNALDSDLFKSTSNNKPETVSVKLDLELPVEKEPYADDAKSEIVQDSEKKVNKLKMNIKIDVNALLPGASPKKKVDQTHRQTDSTEIDGQINSTYNNEVTESKIEESIDAKIVKSVSFEGEADSKVLDNKLSKERARIQVKRRPSTRRARKEAVRKSAIDIYDSTDNSSSIDDPPKSIPIDTASEFKPEVNRVGPESSAVNIRSPDKIDIDIPNHEETIVNIQSPENIVAPNPEKISGDKTSPVKPADVPENTVIDGIEPKAKEVKSKIVYILHDEDIFNTPVNNTKGMTSEKPKLDIFDDDDELFKPKPLRNPVRDDGNSKNGKVSNNGRVSNIGLVSKTKQKSSIFGDDDDDEDELFKNNKTVKKADIFNSDSDDDLFTGRNVRKTKVDKIVVKGSLFGDEDDGDDLFGVKTKKIEPSFQSSKPSTSRETAKSTEAVYDDPLSLLSDDE